MLSYLLLGMTFAFAAAVQPGPFQSYVISQTLSIGWKNTIPVAFAPLLSDVPIILLVLILLSRIPIGLVLVLQCAGGIFLLYLALGAFNNWRDFYGKNSMQNTIGRQTVIKAALVNLLNPNPWLAWSLVMGPLLLKGWQEAPANGLSLLVGFYTTMILTTLGIMLLFSGARNLGPRVSRTLVGISAIAMACFGIYELWSGLKMVWPS